MSACKQKMKERFPELEPLEIDMLFDDFMDTSRTNFNFTSAAYDELNRKAQMNIRDYERRVMAEQLQAIRNLQNMARVQQMAREFAAKKSPNPLVRTFRTMLYGSQYAVKSGRRSTYNSKVAAQTLFSNRFERALKETQNFELFMSGEHQLETMQALQEVMRGREVSGRFGDLARVIKTEYDRLNNARRELGIDVMELNDRTNPNVHDPEIMTKNTREEREQLRDEGKLTSDNLYKVARSRWVESVKPLADLRRIFTPRGIDLQDTQAIDKFFEHAYDNIVNNGSYREAGSANIAEQVNHARVIHWKDANAMLEYSRTYGTGNVFHDIYQELNHGYGQVEVARDWGVNPTSFIENAVKELQQEEPFSLTDKRNQQIDEVKSLLQYMGQGQYRPTATVRNFVSGIKLWEASTKLPNVTLRSIDDVSKQWVEAMRVGENPFKQVVDTFGFFGNLKQSEWAEVSDLVGAGHQIHVGTLYSDSAKQLNNSIKKGTFNFFKWFGLQRWDRSNQAAAAAMLARNMANARELPFERLTENQREIFSRYGIERHHWEAIRQGARMIANKKYFILPESVYNTPDAALASILKETGEVRVTPSKLSMFRQEVERLFRGYITDRQNHVIFNIDPLDQRLATPGLNRYENKATYIASSLWSYLRTYSVGYFRRHMAEAMYGKGAMSIREAVLGGKADWGKLTNVLVSGMTLNYAVMSLRNLSLGQTPPSLRYGKTWVDLIRNSLLGPMGFILSIAGNDALGSLAHAIAGPAITDISKAGSVLYNLVNDSLHSNDYRKTRKAFFALSKNNIPLLRNIFTEKALNNYIMDSWQDRAAPGQRLRTLQKLRTEQGVQPIQ